MEVFFKLKDEVKSRKLADREGQGVSSSAVFHLMNKQKVGSAVILKRAALEAHNPFI